MAKTKFDFNKWLITNYKNYDSIEEVTLKWGDFRGNHKPIEQILTDNNIDYERYFQAKRDNAPPRESIVLNFTTKQELMKWMSKYKRLTVFHFNTYYFYLMAVKNKRELIIEPPVTKVIASWKGFRIKELKIRHTDVVHPGKKKDWIVTTYYVNVFGRKITLTPQPKERFKITTDIPDNIKIITWKQAMEQM